MLDTLNTCAGINKRIMELILLFTKYSVEPGMNEAKRVTGEIQEDFYFSGQKTESRAFFLKGFLKLPFSFNSSRFH